MASATPADVIAGRPTLYRGIRMRSRLEADYAAELDSQGQRWEYEPECFASHAGQWLPDFGGTFADHGPLAMFTEVKPGGKLRGMVPGSVEYVEHVDAILRRMEIAWDSRPDASLSLMFWEYGGPWYLHIFSVRRGMPWLAEQSVRGPALLWIGMGQLQRLRGA